jgi:ribosomal peptide maturation radical SAM protein 1
MPWADAENPSLALAVLKAKLLDNGRSCTVHHLNLLLLKYLELDSYKKFADLYAINDFLFTQALQGEEVGADQLEAFTAFATHTWNRVDLLYRRDIEPQPYVDFALAVRNDIIPQYLQDCLETLDLEHTTMVGFTCVFDQTFASLALAKFIKHHSPDTLIVFGGYALEGPVGPQILRCFPFVDVVALGEGEEQIVALADASIDRTALARIPGLLYRAEDGSMQQTMRAATLIDLDTSPTPNYDDWFANLQALERAQQIKIDTDFLPVESSRGCWWGQVSHCVFCGIDDDTMRYRAKTPSRMLETLRELLERYNVRTFRFSDYILPRQYFKTLLPTLAHSAEDITLHWEMKSNVKYEDVELLRRARVYHIQPGIESFSSAVLKRMDKGVTGIQNVFTLRSLMENYIDYYYNILYGFPGDDPADYRAMIRNIPSLYHFYPPGAFTNVLITRFSPLQTAPQRFGIASHLVAEPRYDIILSRQYREHIGFKLEDYCYVFKMPYELDQELYEQFDLLTFQLSYWNEIWSERFVQLAYENTEHGVRFADSRFEATPRVMEFGLRHQVVHERLRRRILTRKQLAAELQEHFSPAVTEHLVDELLHERLLYEENGRLIDLALPQVYYDWAIPSLLGDDKESLEPCGLKIQQGV